MPADKKVPTLTFDETGALTGSSGVNRFRTTADMTQLAEGKLSLRPIAGTRMAGPSQAMKEETQFLKALEKARVWKVSGRTLYLEDDRKALLVLRRRS